MRPEYIDLNRTFLDFDEDSDVEGAAYKSYLANMTGGTDWQSLLQSRFVVVLGEPGSGKTWELEAQPEKLRKDGLYAFFMRIDVLATGTFEAAIDAHDSELFLKWQAGQEEATFFLDSVDEAKLKSPKAFQDALNAFVKGVGGAVARSQVVVSCRYYEWRASTDKQEFMRRFSIPVTTSNKRRIHRPKANETPPLLSIVQLAPLDAERIKALARHRNAPDIAGFMAAISIHNLWDFAGRPKDVENLVTYWQENHRFGTRTEMIEYDINHKLKESSDREKPDPLTIGMPLQGAQCLAAAVIFCRRFNFIVPDDSIDPKLAADTLAPAEVLPHNWAPKQVHSLLDRAVFDEATYGRVRFHHRSIAEYLAASWLSERLKNNCPFSEIEALLFCRCHERDVVIPSRTPLAAWLSAGEGIHHQRIRDKVLRSKPELLLQHGDPEMLPLETRKALLRALVDRYADRKVARVDADRDLLRRLAHADLAGDISQYILDQAVSEDIRELFLRIACNGKLAGCVAAALQIASDKGGGVWLRYHAIELICDCGNNHHLTHLAEIISQYRAVPQRVCGLICDRLFPAKMDVNALISLIQQVEPIVENASNYLPDELKELFLHNTPADLVTPLLAGLLILAEERPRIRFEDKESPVSSRYLWLYEPLHALVQRLLQKSELDGTVSSNIVQALILFRHFKKAHSSHGREEDMGLQAASESHPDIRRAYVWRRIAEFKAKSKDSRAIIWGVFDHYSAIQLSAVDQKWLLEDIRRLPLKESKIAMELATDLWSSIGQTTAFRTELKRVSRKSPELKAVFSKHVPNKLQLVFYRFRYRTWRELRQKVKSFFRKIRVWWYEQRNHWWYWRHLDDLRSGNAVRALHNMYCDSRDHESSADHDSGRWLALVPRFGEKVAQAVRDGWKASWRAYTPQFPFERDNTGSRDGRITLGQIGIKTEIEDGLDISALSLDDARILVRYALWETNDNFQQWLTVLENRYTDLVRDALETCIKAEWHTSTEQPYFYGMLSQLENTPEKLQRLPLPKTITLLCGGDPQHTDILKQALTLLFDSSTLPSDQIARLASQRIRNYEPNDGHFLVWLIAWLNLDASGALDYLEELSRNQSCTADALFISLGSALSELRSSRMPHLDNPSFRRADSLIRFISLCFKHIRPEEDIDRTSGGVFTSTARDEAQHFRGTLLKNLAESKESHAFQRLQELLVNPLLESRKDYILHLLDEKAESDAEPSAWRAQYVVTFMNNHETLPHSSDDLFRITLTRFTQIKDSVENADFSQRRDLRQDDPEETLQVWLARQLESSASGIYKVIREPEVDRKKKPDIRLVIAGLNPVTIEIKWAHDWSYNELEKALYDQLIGLYMKTNRSRHGILMLATHEVKRQWQAPDGKLIGFDQLIIILKERASGVLKTRMDIDGLEVVGLNFT